MMILERTNSQKFINLDKVIAAAEAAGFEVVGSQIWQSARPIGLTGRAVWRNHPKDWARVHDLCC